MTKMPSMDDSASPEIEILRQASAGLLYPSESDVPFDVFNWDEPGLAQFSAEDVVSFHIKKGRTIEEVAIDPFFAAIEDAWDAERLKSFRQTLQTQLTGLRIFRVAVGEAEVDIYLLGQTATGSWAGLHTVSVET